VRRLKRGARRDVDRDSSQDEKAYLDQCTPATHVGIVCDICRAKDFDGVRYKCANCKDYDLCGACEVKTYKESLGLMPRSCTLFACPFANCPLESKKELTECGLRDHVWENHHEDGQMVKCPICQVNGSVVLLSQPIFSEHLRETHCDDHDLERHTLIKIPRRIVHTHLRSFDPLPPFDLVVENNEDVKRTSEAEIASSSSSSSSASAWNIAHRHQQRVAHAGITCSHCHTENFSGVRYACYNCPDYNLCSGCEAGGVSLHGHNPWHLFMKLRRPMRASPQARPSIFIRQPVD